MTKSFTLKASIITTPEWIDNLDLSEVKDTVKYRNDLELTNGTGDLQADGWYRDQMPVGPSTTIDFDLTSMSRIFMGGSRSQHYDSIKYLFIENTGDVTIYVGGSIPTNSWSKMAAAIEIEKGGIFLVYNPQSGWPVTSTSKILRIQNTNTTTSGEIKLILSGVRNDS